MNEPPRSAPVRLTSICILMCLIWKIRCLNKTTITSPKKKCIRLKEDAASPSPYINLHSVLVRTGDTKSASNNFTSSQGPFTLIYHDTQTQFAYWKPYLWQHVCGRAVGRFLGPSAHVPTSRSLESLPGRGAAGAPAIVRYQKRREACPWAAAGGRASGYCDDVCHGETLATIARSLVLCFHLAFGKSWACR